MREGGRPRKGFHSEVKPRLMSHATVFRTSPSRPFWAYEIGDEHTSENGGKQHDQ
jgi:hypothetical protein